MSADLDARAAEVLRVLRDHGTTPGWWSTREVWAETWNGRSFISGTVITTRLRRLTKLGLVEHRRAPYTSTGRLRDEWRVREEMRDD